MKKSLVSILAVFILAISLAQTVNYALYLIDKNEIVEKFCENKKKPNLNCQGKCYLKKTALAKSSAPSSFERIELLELYFENSLELFFELKEQENPLSDIAITPYFIDYKEENFSKLNLPPKI